MTSQASPSSPPIGTDAAAQTAIETTTRRKFSKRERRLVRACEQLLQGEIQAIGYPGGRSRDAFSITLADGHNLIAAKRANIFRADLEQSIVSALEAGGAPVPSIIAYDGKKLLIQQRLEGPRLSAALHTGDDDDAARVLEAALKGLALSQRAGTTAGLEERVPVLGQGKDWINDLLRRPLVIGGYFQERPPRPRIDALRKLLRVQTPRFIKWDARPGNAIVTSTQRVDWFDWEHCGARNRLDDVAWLLCDEFTPDRPAVEQALLARHIDTFADGRSTDEAFSYLYAFGVFHAVVRLGLILSRKKDEPWWELDYCIERDKAGVTLEQAQRLTTRAARWANEEDMTRPLSAWFSAIGEKLQTL